MVPQSEVVLRVVLIVTSMGLGITMVLALTYLAAKSASHQPDEMPILREEGDKMPSLARLMALYVILDERLDATDRFFAGDPTAYEEEWLGDDSWDDGF